MTSVPMRTLITGAGGFIGSAMVARALANGSEVRACIRPGKDATAVRALGADVVEADIADGDRLFEIMRDCSHVIHLAAAKPSQHPPAGAFNRVNVHGTQQVLRTALQADVQRVVVGGAVGVHGFVTSGVLTEDSPIRANTAYRQSKWRAEVGAISMHREWQSPVVIARISTVVGAGAMAWLPLVNRIATKNFRYLGDGENHLDLVAIDDLVDGLWRCLVAPGIEGRSYLLGSVEPITVRTFTTLLANALGVPAPRRGPPRWPYRVHQHCASMLNRLFGVDSEFAHAREWLVSDKVVSSERARREAGYAPRVPIAQAINEMVEYFRVHGKIVPKPS